MAKGLALLLAPKGKGSMFDSKFKDSEEDAEPESERGEGEYDDDALANMAVLFPDADKDDLPDMLEAFKAIFRACEKEPHEEAEHDDE